VQQHGGDPDERDGDQRLHERRREAHRKTLCERALAGDEIRGDHRLAVAGSRRMEDAVGEANPGERPERRAVALQRQDGRLQAPIKTALDRQNPRPKTLGRRSRLAQSSPERVFRG
jgi:hypothetical protein